MNKSYKFRVFCAAAIALIATPCLAADFTISVPISATGLPAGVNKMRVSCQILTPVNMPVVGAGSTVVPITGGAFSGDVVVTASAPPSIDPATATRYKCDAWFSQEDSPGSSRYIYYEPGRTPDGRMFQNFPLVPGAPFRLSTGYVSISPR